MNTESETTECRYCHSKETKSGCGNCLRTQEAEKRSEQMLSKMNKNSYYSTGEIKLLYEEKNKKISLRTIRRYGNKLVKKGLLTKRKARLPTGGRSTIWRKL